MELDFDYLIKRHKDLLDNNKTINSDNDNTSQNKQYDFIQSILQMLNDIDSSFEFCNSSLKQIKNLPCEDWISRVDLTNDKFVLYTYSFFTTILYTIIDQLLLLINRVSISEMNQKYVNYKSLQKIIDKKYDKLKLNLETLFNNTNEIARKRHEFIHHGQLRKSPILSTVHQMKPVFFVFKVSENQIAEIYEEAYNELIKLMEAEYNSIKETTTRIKKSLIEVYEDKLEKIMGIHLPTEDEIISTCEALTYFDKEKK